jgi:glycosyltransferase involved in cell wall biosynthesis
VTTVRLAVLSGGLESAERAVAALYPHAEVELLDKERLRGKGRLALLRELRRRPVDRFVYFTYVNAWQLGRFRMLAFALLSGAGRAALLDVEHELEEFAPSRVWLRELPRTVLELALAPVVVVGSILAAWLHSLRIHKDEQDEPGKQDQENPVYPRESTSKQLDVLFVRPTPTIGVMEAGESAHMRGVLDGLRALGHRTRVLSNDELPAIRRAGHPLEVRRPGPLFNATPLAFELWNNHLFTRHLEAEIRRERPDLVYQRHSRNSWAGAVAARRAKVPFVLEWNNSEAWATRHWSPFGWWARVVAVVERLNLRAADRIVVVSRALAEALERAGVARRRIVVNPNGVEPERFRPGAGGDAVRRHYALGDAIVVGFVGSFNYYQGATTLMEAAPEVCHETDARFLLVGYGETLAAARTAAEAGGVSDRVVFTDRIPVDDVPAFVDACDVAVAPMRPNPDGSPFFNSPVKVFEYMAAGRAIVASRLGQIEEVIEDGETGLLVEPESPRALARAIVRLARDPALRARLGENARRAAVARHTWRRNAERVVAVYDEIRHGRCTHSPDA